MIEVNILGVILAGIASMAVGFAWYSSYMFGKKWIKLMGLDEKKMKAAGKEMGKMYALSLFAAFVTAYVLTHTMALSGNFYGYSAVQTGLSTAFWMWLGFVMPVQLTDVIFGGRKWDLFYINTGYQLAALLVMGVVLAQF